MKKAKRYPFLKLQRQRFALHFDNQFRQMARSLGLWRDLQQARRGAAGRVSQKQQDDAGHPGQ